MVADAAGRRAARSTGESVYVCVDDNSRAAYVEILDDERASTRWGSTTDHRSCPRRGPPGAPDGTSATSHPPLPASHQRKAERFIQTLLREWAYAAVYQSSQHRGRALTTWIGYYNHRRSNGSLGKRPPASRLTAD